MWPRLVGVLTASVASWFVPENVKDDDSELLRKIHAELQELKKQID
jgi:hypothetical protein